MGVVFSLSRRLRDLAFASFLTLPSCSPSLGSLCRELDSAADADTVLRAARALVLEHGGRGARAVQGFDARRADFAFDAEHSIAVAFDARNGSLCHEQMRIPQGAGVATGDPALDQAIMAAVPYETSRVHLGLPSDDFIEIAHSDTPRGPLFVVKLANADRYKALRRNIDGGRLGPWIILEVDATSLEPIPLGRAEDR